MSAPLTPATEERHATWLELFFDLVIVVAVAQLAHLLRDEPGPHEVFLFAILYYAIWNVWTAFTLYANVSGPLTRTRSMLLAMFGIAVMAASVPRVHEDEPGLFVLAYVYCRLAAAGSWKRTGRVMVEWPGVQHAVGVIPWIVSLGFDGPVRYGLWVLAVVLDVALSLVRSRDPEALLAQERRANHAPVEAATMDRPHLGERLGLFVIIVLGEAVAQIVDAVAEAPHGSGGLLVMLGAGFGLLVALWWLTLRYGPGAAPAHDGGVRVGALRLTLPSHYLVTASIVVLAAGLGALAGHPAEAPPEANRWVLCGGAALYFLTVTVIGATGGAPLRWTLGWGVPAVLAAVLLGVSGGPLRGWALAAVLLAVALWHVAYHRLAATRSTGTAVT